MTSVSKNAYIDILGNIVNKYNNIYFSRSEMKPVDVKLNTYIDSNKEINNKDPKTINCDIVKISKYKKSFKKLNL